MTLADPKVFMEAMLSEMGCVMKLELEQVHERTDQMESARERQPQNVPNLRRRERVQPREVRVEDEEPYRAGFDDEDDRDSVDLSSHFLIEFDGIHVPVKHNPFNPAVPHLRRLRRHRRQQNLSKPFPPITLPHKQVLHIEPWFRQERRIIWKKQHESSNNDVVTVRSEQLRFGVSDGQVEIDRFRDRGIVRMGLGGEGVGGDFEDEDGEGLEGRGGVVIEEGGREGGFSGREEVGEALEDGHLVDEFVDVWDVGLGGEAYSGEDWVADRAVFR
ncbi:hypothetical protein F0562_025986 [Nyssa sinensis]|uniref:Uncharacterized protein n=1 Tax=Nyssa sinensis TaxID=561372 RepID=A0A5J5B9I4_9ASTE|nr:hypothetical protein F0562_025986 [Nyssa sinensis]